MASNSISNLTMDESLLIRMKKVQPRPPGCSFLGASAVILLGQLMTMRSELIRIIIDSGSDITLISEELFRSLSPPPKKINGRKINLIQVTGTARINGYAQIPIFFNTEKGPVNLEVEAYIVKGMSTPFILGNDFADQYQLSILRNEGNTKVSFGETG